LFSSFIWNDNSIAAKSVDPSNESFMMFGTDCEFKGLSHFTIEESKG